MKSLMKWTVSFALSVAFLGTAAHAATWRLKVFNIDDKIDVLIDGSLVHTCAFNKECEWDITNEMKPGVNTILLRLTNTGLGYTYGYALAKDNVIYGQDACGIVTFVGCADNDFTTGDVRDVAFRVTK
jgi:hypothetical protein